MEGDPQKVVVELDLAGLWVDAEGRTFSQMVVDRASRRLLEGDGGATRSEFVRRVQAIRDEEIREALRPVMAEALEQAVQQTDSFGTPRGEPRTLRELVVEEATKMLREKRYERGRQKETLVEKFVRDEVERTLRAELTAAVNEAKAEVVAAVRDNAAEVIAETIDRARRGAL